MMLGVGPELLENKIKMKEINTKKMHSLELNNKITVAK